MFTFTPVQQNFGLLILRIGLGIMMMAHGFPKLMGGPERWEAVGSAMKYFGLTDGYLYLGLAAALAEFFGGAMLVLGLFTRVVCFSLFFTMLVATVRHFMAGDGFGGWSHAAEVGIVFFSLIWIGPGSFSLDNWWFRRKSNPKNIYIG